MIIATIVAQPNPSVSILWWQAAWVGNTVTAIATIAGVGLTQYLANRRDNRHRWTDRRLDAYATFTMLAMDAIRYLEDMPLSDESPDEVAARLSGERLSEATNLIRLVAPPGTFRACIALSKGIRKLSEDAVAMFGRVDYGDNATYNDRVAQIERMRAEMQTKSVEVRSLAHDFVRLAQHDLGVRT